MTNYLPYSLNQAFADERRAFDRELFGNIFPALDHVAEHFKFRKKFVNILDLSHQSINFIANFLFPRCSALLVLPLVVSNGFSFAVRLIVWLHTISKACSVGNFFDFIKRFFIGIKFLSVNAIGVYDDVVE